jgi:hypothetical protein
MAEEEPYTEYDGPDKRGGSGRGTIALVVVSLILIAIAGATLLGIWLAPRILS